MNLPHGAWFWLIETVIVVSGLKHPLKQLNVCRGKSAVLSTYLPTKYPSFWQTFRPWEFGSFLFHAENDVQRQFSVHSLTFRGSIWSLPQIFLTSLSWMREHLLLSFTRVLIALAFVRALAWVFDVLPCSTKSLRVPMCPFERERWILPKKELLWVLMRERNIVNEHKG